ncbi:MAG: putative DNA binding domain-containing protein [Acidobacteria bacterium]|nr:putative DNA binding domain-containing protein [Acidobacteriota bacterium]
MERLPFSLDNLLHADRVEDTRVEFKAGWDDRIKEATARTICAFANDLLNVNGGYIIIGVEQTDDGKPELPPRGLQGLDVEKIQREIRGQCMRIDPPCAVVLFCEVYQGKQILVVRAPAGDSRPYQAPRTLKGSERAYYVRYGAETIEARGELLRQLFELTNRTPFDSRRNPTARIEDISSTLVRRFLADVRSDLILSGVSIDDRELCRSLDLVVRVNDHEVPRNAALLFFSETPEKFFRGACFEVAHFGDGAGGNLIEERVFRGPLPAQVRGVLNYLDSLMGQIIRKLPEAAEAEKVVAYPYEAMEEAVVNAAYHRSYQEDCPESSKIYLYPDRMEIISYPGPVGGLLPEHFSASAPMPKVPARNQRIGELLKDLRLAERRFTGVPRIRRRMKENGSPDPVFDFDEGRTYFRVTLPAHPQYRLLHAIREAAHLWAVGERSHAIERLLEAFRREPASASLASQLIQYYASSGDLQDAQVTFDQYHANPLREESARPYLRYADALLAEGKMEEAKRVLSEIPSTSMPEDLLESAILAKRAGDYRNAHQVFDRIRGLMHNDPKFLQEFAQTKMRIAGSVKGDRATNRRLVKEAEELLHRALQLSESEVRRGWCWFDLARVLEWLKKPVTETEEAFLQAKTFLPREERIENAYRKWKSQQTARRRKP